MRSAVRYIGNLFVALMVASPLLAEDLRYQGRTVAEWMAQMRRQPTDKEGDAVVRALSHFGHRAVPTLIVMLRDQDPQERLIALWAFFTIGPAPKEVLPELIRLAAKDDTQDVRTMAELIGTSWLIHEPARDTVPPLLHALHDPDVELRRAAAHWMAAVVRARGATIAPQLAAQVASPLAQVLREVDVQRRREIIATLRAIGPPARAAIPELRRLIRDDPETMHEAETALHSINR